MERLNSSILHLCRCPVSENCRFRVNWTLMCALNFLGGIVFLATAPSLHQFVTSNSNSSDPSITPGLDLSESWYTLIVSANSIGVIVAAIIYSIISRSVYYKLLIITVLIVNILGGLLYAIASNGWTLLSARFFIGVYYGVILAQMRTYIGESTDNVLAKQKLKFETKQTKSPPSTHLKNTVFFILVICGVTGVATGPLLETIASNISSLDQFRWPGYYLVGHSLILLVLVILFFDEKWDDINRRDVYKNERKRTAAIGPRCKIEKPAIPLYVSYTRWMDGWNVSVVETLENPILSDNFGFNIKYTSYIMLGTLSMFIVGSVGTYLLQRCNIDNRILLIGSFIIGAIGTILIGDWQSISGDPCHQIHKDVICSNTSEYITGSGLDCIDCNITSNPLCSIEHHTLSSCVNTTDNIDSACLCELFSNTPGYQCFWNPNSRITGEYCEQCRRVCLSRTHSINLVQLTVGIGLLAGTFPIGRLLVTILASNLFGPTSQGSGTLMGVLIATGAIAQISGSFWGDAAYVAVGYRTWLTMLLLNVLQLSVILLYCVFYRKFVPQPVKVRSEDDRELLQFEEELDDKFDAETKL